MSPLLGEQGFQIAKPKTGRPVLMFDHNHTKGRIGKQFEKTRSAVIGPRPHLFDHLGNPLAFGAAVGDESLRLTVKIRAIFCCGHAGIDGNSLRFSHLLALSRLLDHDGS